MAVLTHYIVVKQCECPMECTYYFACISVKNGITPICATGRTLDEAVAEAMKLQELFKLKHHS